MTGKDLAILLLAAGLIVAIGALFTVKMMVGHVAHLPISLT